MADRVHTRIDPRLKQDVSQILNGLGMTEGDAVRMFYHQIRLHNGLPFAVNLPNATTEAALREDLTDAKRYSSFEDIQAELDS